jgi:hypothetical protein
MIAEAVTEAGIVDRAALAELQRWGLPVTVPDDSRRADLEGAVQKIQAALEARDSVEVRLTDLDVFSEYLATEKKARLRLVAGEKSGELEVSFGLSRHGEYIVPWKAAGIEEIIANGRSCLIDGRRKIYFKGVRELYFGGKKAFMVLTRAGAEDHAGQKA